MGKRITIDTASLEIVLRLVVEVGIVEHGLGRDAPHVQTCSAERAPLLNARSLSPPKKFATDQIHILRESQVRRRGKKEKKIRDAP